MHEDLLKERHLEAMRQLKEENRRQEAMRRLANLLTGGDR